ncbi:ATP-binding cassette domain-containing protein [Janthinobacterium agaricidamnosum]|uniref:Aliphatic sulfonates import ATP-binding protein SsuB n=1 Tax=Janthinobacterium agaricidamnosum NBRC 102515 = DSM 9628 TaxID=1349767 RepID=W0V4F8_9BURK|nr:ATP-binding cassette domain-containing protein [Janthinobacterium agaricidamnosum]CDG82455.1 aliphatic sulfonates import ATP-binding protein SsuB [Janthinobacterium agaricidamnosum NBRC 102515 = DSM 9628]
MILAPTQFESDVLSFLTQADAVEHTPLRRTTDQAAARQGVPLALAGLSKSYDRRQVLKNVDLQLKAGEFVAIVGRSGCGKSTLLRTIAQLETPDGGSIQYGSHAGNGAGKPNLRIMFQEARLLPWKTVLENVALGLPRSVGAAAASLWTVGLADRADEWPSALSGGQRQRVALARALVHEPQLLLLDEPLGALDALTRIEMQRLIESLWLARGFTAVLVTHDVAEAVALADRVLLIEDGNITLDVAIDLPRPRARGSAAFAALEQRILSYVLSPA